MTELVRDTNRLCIHTMNGKKYFSLVPPAWVPTRYGLGSYALHELKDGLETKSLDELIRLFTQPKPETSKPKGRPWETDPKLRLDMINRLASIIQQSTEKGEVENSKALYRRLSGREWGA